MDDSLSALTAQLIRCGIIVALAIVVRIIVRVAIGRCQKMLLARPAQRLRRVTARAGAFVAGQEATQGSRHRQRVETLASLLRSVTDIVLVIVVVFTVLAIFHVPTGPLVASAGIGGVALGFGAQSLVKDYLSGIFILAEDQFGVGDVITIDDVTGTVEEVTLRVTRLRAASGTTWYLRNGEILRVGNLSQAATTTIVEVLVAPDEDPERAAQVVQGALDGMHEEEEFVDALTAQPTVLGVGGVDAAGLTLQVLVTALPNQQWAPLRAVRARAQQALLEAGIRGPLLPGAPPPE